MYFSFKINAMVFSGTNQNVKLLLFNFDTKTAVPKYFEK